MKIKRIVAREWLILVICLSIGFAGYVLDDCLAWKKQKSSHPMTQLTSRIEEARKQGYTDEQIYEFFASKSRTRDKPKTILDFKPEHFPQWYAKWDKYHFFGGYSKRPYLLLLPYLLCLFGRSIIWSIGQLKK